METPLWNLLKAVCPLALVLVLSAATHELWGQSSASKFRVRVNISAENDAVLRSSITSYINRELRSLGDVESVDDASDFTLHVIVFSTTNSYNQPIGIAIGTSITERLAIDYLKNSVPEDRKVAFDFLIHTSEVFSTSLLNVGPAAATQEICRQIVTTFDGEVLESRRKLNQKMKDFVKPPSSFKR